MLSLTRSAAAVIRGLLDRADLPPGAGLRIAQRDDHTALAMTLQEQPGDADVVVREEAVTVFLGPAAASRTDDQVLDASSTPTSSALYLREGAAPAAREVEAG